MIYYEPLEDLGWNDALVVVASKADTKETMPIYFIASALERYRRWHLLWNLVSADVIKQSTNQPTPYNFAFLLL